MVKRKSQTLIQNDIILNFIILIFVLLFYIILIYSYFLMKVGNGCCIDKERIYFGKPAKQEGARHMVSIQRLQFNTEYIHICGGSLINNRTVLTAAHCLFNRDGSKTTESEFRVVTGTLNLKEVTKSKMSTVRKIVNHENYSFVYMQNDIALLFLDEPIKFSAFVKAIRLARRSTPAGTECKVDGWGLTEDDEHSDILLSINIPIVDNQQCIRTHRNNIKNGMFCAGHLGERKDACQADSGGPLTCNGLLTGIVSWGPSPCGNPDRPGVYTNVSYYNTWITKTVDEYSADNTLWVLGAIAAAAVSWATLLTIVL